MLYVWLVSLVLLNACWLGLLFFMLPGNWLMVTGTALFAWWRWEDGVFSVWTLAVITLLAAIGEIVEFFGGLTGAKKAGAGLKGAIAAIFGAIAGAVLGTVLIPVVFVGTIMGACFGAGLATWAAEKASGRKENSVRSGVGAGTGVLFGMTVKIFIGILIWLIITIAAFWP